MTNQFDTLKLYKLVAAAFSGHPFPAPEHVWFGGEIKQSWAFCHPYSVEAVGDRLVISSPDGDSQEWALVS